jgi:lysophospholipase L1-like esterase
VKLDSGKYHRSKQVTPLRIGLMLVGLNLLLGLIVLLFPDGQRQLFNKLDLQFVSFEELTTPKELVVVDMDSVLGDIVLSDTIEEVVAVEPDTTFDEPEAHKKIVFADSVQRGLIAFFKALREVENGGDELIRILHYGDSQLEGDRISDYLRNKLQNRFGGYGPGIVLPIDISRARVSVRQSESRDWKKYAIYSKSRLKGGYYGIGGSSYQYTGKYNVKVGEDTLYQKVYDSLIVTQVKQRIESDDSSIINDTSKYVMVEVSTPFDTSQYHIDTVYKPIYEQQEAEYSWLRYRCATRSYPRVRTFSEVSLMYQSFDTCELIVQVDGGYRKITLFPSPIGALRKIHTGGVQSEVMLKFSGSSPTILGVFLDGERGIAVDNFPMRGSSGTGFSMINQSLYRRQLQTSNAKLVVMQYGINVVPNPVKNYDFYERMFKSELQAIKRANPELDILVIGPSDMSRKRAGEYQSYPNITLIRDAMKNAAFETGCAFWDLYTVMGGENAMVSWVNNDPTLAAKDYTHFNHRGARFVGEMLYNALMSEYDYWKRNNPES